MCDVAPLSLRLAKTDSQATPGVASSPFGFRPSPHPHFGKGRRIKKKTKKPMNVRTSFSLGMFLDARLRDFFKSRF
jgi:hypothetical protein